MRVHSAVDEMWLTALVDYMQSIATNAMPVSLEASLRSFLSNGDWVALSSHWRKRKLVIEGRRTWKHNSMERQMPEVTDVLLQHYEVVYSYTVQKPNVFQKVSCKLNNEKLRSEDEGNGLAVSKILKPFMPWVTYLERSLMSLPTEFDYEGLLYRGMKFRYGPPVTLEFAEQFPMGGRIAFYSFKSFSTDKNILDDDAFCGLEGIGEGSRTGRTIFIILNGKGKLIAPLSNFPDEGEVLLPPGTKFEIVNAFQGDQLQGSALDHADIVELRIL